MPLILLSIPGLRERDLSSMPNLRALTRGGEQAVLTPSFPCVTCAVQANMTTGKLPAQHGVVANGLYWRDRQEVEMWTTPNDCIAAPQVWDILAQHDDSMVTAVWFPLHSKGAGADLVCTPAPIHNPDGSESLWCYTKPTELYAELRDTLDHFPLQHFWGPLANIKSTDWIIDSAIITARKERPDFFYIYVPHLDYAAQRSGPDSPEAAAAVAELDVALGRLFAGCDEAYRSADSGSPVWVIASEYTITPVSHVLYPNRVLREAGLLVLREETYGQNISEYLDLSASRAWALVDHQFSHIFTQPGDDAAIEEVCRLFSGREGVAEILLKAPHSAFPIPHSPLSKYPLDHERSGDVVLISTPESWQAYYWWLDDSHAPPFARTVDIHRKPGYDPVELFFDPATRGIPLDASLVRGSHGAPAETDAQRGVILSSQPGVLGNQLLLDKQVYDVVLRYFGC